MRKLKSVFIIFVLSVSGVCLAQVGSDLRSSGFKYSQMTRMFESRVAGAFGPNISANAGVFSWTNTGDRATVRWNSPNQYEETFARRGRWIVLSDWASVETAPDRTKYNTNYVISTRMAFLIIRGRWIDITDRFRGGPHPYALEDIPDETYSIYVQADLLEFINGKRSSNPTLFFQWYATYERPEMRPTLFLGTRMGIRQAEHWIDSAGNDTYQSQVICLGYGLLCYGNPSGAQNPVGVFSAWNW